jgi:hypothetical protein
MRDWKRGLVGAGFVFLLLWLSDGAEARVSFGLSIGTSLGHRYPGYGYGYSPYAPWCDGYYTWPDRGPYAWMDAGRYRHFPRRHYWPRHSHSSRLGVWIGGYHPVVIGAPVGSRPDVKDPGEAADRAKQAAIQAQIRKALERRKGELVKTLKTGDKEKRIQAIHELAAFSSDNGIRQALEEVLLSDPDPELRKEVAVSFGKTENLLVLAALTQAKENDPVRDVRQAAYRSIIMIKGY